MLVDPTYTVAESYDVRLNPFAFLIDENGIIRLRGLVNSWPQLDALMEEEGTVSPTSLPGSGTLNGPPIIPSDLIVGDHKGQLLQRH